MNWRIKLRALFRKEKLDAEMSEELGAHLELQAAENRKRGMSASDAHYAAQRQFGGVEQIKERVRAQRGFGWLEQLVQDLNHAARSLRKSPGFATVVVLSLALGIGANTTIFSLVNAFLLRSLPVRNPEELVIFRYLGGARGWMANSTQGNGGKDPVTGRAWHSAFSLLMFEQFRAQHPGLSEVIGHAPFAPNALIDGQIDVAASGQLVSGNYFSALGVSASFGRALAPDDDRASAEPVAVISDRYWQNRFGRDPAVLGKVVHVNGVATTIVGVTPPGFSGAMQVGDSPDLTVALGLARRFQPDGADKVQPWFWWIRIMGRLLPGTTAAQARAGLEPAFQEAAREGWRAGQTLKGAIRTEMPDAPTLIVESGAQGENDRRRDYAKALRILMGLVGLVLLTACANVANLLLARGTSRGREIAVRMALGAGRGRIVRQLLAESLLLAFGGAVIGALLAGWGRELLLALHPVGNNVVLDLPLDGQVLGFTAAVTAATALTFGLAPALRATRLDLTAAFQGGTRSLGGGGRSRLGQTLMVVQIAFSLVLLVSTGLFVRTLRNLQNVDPGFNRRDLVLFRVEAVPAGYKPAQFAALHRRVKERIDRLPGVKASTYSELAVISGRRIGRSIIVPGYAPPAGGGSGALTNHVAADFFAVMEMPLVLGRGFTDRDDAASPKVAVVNQAFVRQFFPNETPIGRHFRWKGGIDKDIAIEIVGVARDAKFTDLRDDAGPTIYTPMLQAAYPDGIANFALRVAGEPTAAFSAIHGAVREVDPTLPVRNLRTQDEQIDRLNAQPLLFARLSGLFGALALALACVGLYGLMSYNVLRRTGEIGLRVALGALPSHVLRMILGESLRLVGTGLVVGVAGACAASRLIASMLFDLSPMDPATYGIAALGLTAIALLAAFFPARRAAKVDPMIALRTE